MTEDTQEIILLALFRLKVLMLKQNDPALYQELEHIFEGLKEAAPVELLPHLWQPRRVELPNLN